MIYAGIGSRETPAAVLTAMEDVARYLARRGWILRSGAADGADSAFERGCDAVGGSKEIYLPWPGFNGSTSPLNKPTLEMQRMAERFHPQWHRCGHYARMFHARNCAQVLGRDLDWPASVVICYTHGGALKGGTSQALRIAEHHNIPILNFGSFAASVLPSPVDVQAWLNRRVTDPLS